jgi:hypothetical protein
LDAGADVDWKARGGRTALNACKKGSKCWLALSAAREAKELGKAVGEAKASGPRKAAL